ncbi:MAG TPA: hypothetical protein VFQ52_00060, partial [Rhizomicrobium sp.]|nr:hypothetical protein [Rhizomicrobium sp.]
IAIATAPVGVQAIFLLHKIVDVLAHWNAAGAVWIRKIVHGFDRFVAGFFYHFDSHQLEENTFDPGSFRSEVFLLCGRGEPLYTK